MERQFCIKCGTEITEENCAKIRDCSDQMKGLYISAEAKEDDLATDSVGHLYCMCSGLALFEDEFGCRFAKPIFEKGDIHVVFSGLKRCRYLYPKLQCDCPHFKPSIPLTDR